MEWVYVGPILVRRRWTKITHRVGRGWPGADKCGPLGGPRLPKGGPSLPRDGPRLNMVDLGVLLANLGPPLG